MQQEFFIILVFAAVAAALVTVLALKSKEQFWMETPPKYKRCAKGAYGRPLTFEYDLPEIPGKCNPY
jgi:hypothetical protein